MGSICGKVEAGDWVLRGRVVGSYHVFIDARAQDGGVGGLKGPARLIFLRATMYRDAGLFASLDPRHAWSETKSQWVITCEKGACDEMYSCAA